MGFRNFLYRISRFIWGMSLADRPIIWNELQEIAMSGDWYYSKYLNSRFKAQKKLFQSNLFGFKIQGSERTSSIQPLWIQDSRFKAQKKLLQSNLFGFKIQGSEKNFFNPTCLGSRFKIQGSEKTSSIQPLWIQDSRFKAQKKKLLQSHLLGLKIQDSRFRKNFFNPTSLDSRFKIQGSEKKNFFNPTCLGSRFKIQGSEKTSSIPPVWIQDSRFKAEGLRIQFFFLDLESWILPHWIQEVFLGILNLESWILPPWIQEVFWGSWILNLESYPLGFKKSFGDLESWILDRMYLGKGGMGTKLQKKTMQFLITQKCPKF